ncbi:uncharacterized protein A4U43_C07F38150 [Asparagus officinalis]|uniref:Uncharacterized protein n=1 Tax=Asparagus officinalis TaxID=4686 RepID=A0A5P1ENC8_ASPOF|nr:uncharacterized protein A4U43_C07F38150 [Asparagus officinalis]
MNFPPTAGTAEVRNGGNGVFTEGCCLSSGANQQRQSMSVIQENTLEPGNENNHNMAEVPHSDIVTEAAGLPSIETGHQLSDGGGCSLSGFGEDHPREEPNSTEPCPCSNVLPAAAEVQTIETANGSNLQRVETCENVVDREQSPSLDNGGEVAPTRDVNSGGSEHNINHDTVMEPAIADQHPRESKHNKENQNVSAKLRASLSDKGKRAINAEDTNNLAVNTERKGKTGKKRVSHAVGAPSIMDRNPTARTYEWDDSMDTTPGKSPNPVARRQSPRVKRKSSPGTNVPWTRNFSGRRKKKWWTEEEEHTLRKGVKKYGVGKWALIKESYPDILEERSSGDLKDKWRNITRKK